MKRLLSLTLFLALSMSLFVQTVHGASDSSYGLNDTAKAAELIQYNTPVPELIGNIIGTALSLISVVFFILAIYGGFRMMFARGKDDEFTKGKDILIHAIIGMIVILASYAITQFVFDSVKSGNDPNQKQPLSPECTVAADCKDTSLVCTDGKCVNKNGKEPGSVALGGACTATADCAGAGVTCTAGVCKVGGNVPEQSTCLVSAGCVTPAAGACSAESKNNFPDAISCTEWAGKTVSCRTNFIFCLAGGTGKETCLIQNCAQDNRCFGKDGVCYSTVNGKCTQNKGTDLLVSTKDGCSALESGFDVGGVTKISCEKAIDCMQGKTLSESEWRACLALCE